MIARHGPRRWGPGRETDQGIGGLREQGNRAVAVTERAEAAATRLRALFSRAGGRHSSSWEGIRYCLLVFLGVRVALGVLAVVALGTLPHPAASVGVPGWPAPVFSPGPHNFVTGWEHADALWYLRI